MSGAKQVLTTSLVWAAVLACVLFYFLHHFAVHLVPVSGDLLPLAVAPSASVGTAASAPMRPMEPPLSPLQLTPEQMRSIGVTTGTAEYKKISDDLRATGNVAVNDRLVSNVQVRVSGYIRKGFV